MYEYAIIPPLTDTKPRDGDIVNLQLDPFFQERVKENNYGLRSQLSANITNLPFLEPVDFPGERGQYHLPVPNII